MQDEYSALGNLLFQILIFVIACAVHIQAQRLPAESEHPHSSPENVSGETVAPKTVEDWSTPSLKGDLQPMNAVVGEIYKGDASFTRELTRVQWRSTDPIDLYILKPAGVESPAVVLYLYSYPFELDRFRDDAFCRFLTKNGVAAVGFASALTAERYHSPRPLKEWFVSNLKESLSTSAHDVQMILNYLSTRGDLNMDRVGMFGDGSGATIAILAAAVDPRIKSLDLLDPWGDWPEWIAKSTLIPEKERADFLKPEWLVGVTPLDPVKWLPELITQKIRIRNVATVTVTPNEAKQKIEAAAPPNADIVHFPDANAFQTAASNGTGFDWIKKQVQSEKTLAGGELRSRESDDSNRGRSDNRNHPK
jgi:hypothetical protein